MNKLFKVFKDGIVENNPIFVQFLGMCPTLAVTTSAINGLGMGLSAMAVLVFSNLVISLLRKFIPQKIRIAAYIVIIAGFVTVIDLLLQAYLPDLSQALGAFIPLIVVNCIILARAESFASKNGPILSIADGFGIGAGFTVALVVIASVREILGNGSIFGISIFGSGYQPVTMAVLAPGAFIIFGLLLGGINLYKMRKRGSDNA
ncbi:MAG: electron transport complex subunit E [Clostridia bacterium]|nr:electron transport complex subunit E [Clostridia bacterium]